MMDGRRMLGVIPARGGSRRIPGKNIRLLGGKPLIAWTIEEARQSKYIDRLVLSSEDPGIIEIADSLGCEVLVRPPELGRDDTSGVEPALHAIELLHGFDIIVLLQPTSPFRDVADIDGCIERCVRAGANACVSVVETAHPIEWMYTVTAEGRMRPLQIAGTTGGKDDGGRIYSLNGAIYVARCAWLRQQRTFVTEDTLAHPMPPERSLDIDTEQDWRSAEMIIKDSAAL